jgi:hypothetical protein
MQHSTGAPGTDNFHICRYDAIFPTRNNQLPAQCSASADAAKGSDPRCATPQRLGFTTVMRVAKAVQCTAGGTEQDVAIKSSVPQINLVELMRYSENDVVVFHRKC